MRKTNLFFLIFLLLSLCSFSQNKYTISGYVKDAKTGEELIGAAVFIKELSATGVYTNAYGFYSITLPAGNYTVTAQYLGYTPQDVKVELKQNVKQEFSLNEQISEIKEVVITAERKDENIKKVEM